jgi:hypothetical protein
MKVTKAKGLMSCEIGPATAAGRIWLPASGTKIHAA